MKRFIGTDNFQRAWHDKVFWDSFITVGILVAANIMKLIPSVFLAVMIHQTGENLTASLRAG